MGVKFFSVLFPLTGLLCFAQIETQKTLPIDGVNRVEILANASFSIEIFSTHDTLIRIKNSMEGEYADAFRVATMRNGGLLKLIMVPQPSFQPPNDKLSAHKVYSVSLQLWIPKHLNIHVESSLAQLNIYGPFEYLRTRLGDGDCRIYNHFGAADIQTTQGDIWLQTSSATIQTTTQSGLILLDANIIDGPVVKLQTLSGDIRAVLQK